jgi:hypothetical protein
MPRTKTRGPVASPATSARREGCAARQAGAGGRGHLCRQACVAAIAAGRPQIDGIGPSIQPRPGGRGRISGLPHSGPRAAKFPEGKKRRFKRPLEKDSNLRLSAWQADALSTELSWRRDGNRTRILRISSGARPLSYICYRSRTSIRTPDGNAACAGGDKSSCPLMLIRLCDRARAMAGQFWQDHVHLPQRHPEREKMCRRRNMRGNRSSLVSYIRPGIFTRSERNPRQQPAIVWSA